MESASLEGDSEDDLYPKFVPYHPQNLSPPQEVLQQIPCKPSLTKSQDEILDMDFDGTRRSKTYMPEFEMVASGVGTGLMRSNEDIRDQSDGF